MPKNNVHEQCKTAVVQTVAQHSARCHQTTLSCCMRRTRALCSQSRMLCMLSHSIACVGRVLDRDIARPAQPCRDTKKTMSRNQTGQPCLDREKLYHDILQFHTEVPLSRHKKSCRDTKPDSQCSSTVATSKLCLDTKVLVVQHLVVTLKTLVAMQDRGPKEVCHDRPPPARPRSHARRSSIVRAGARAMCAAPLLSRHHCSVATQNLKWVVAHPV